MRFESFREAALGLLFAAVLTACGGGRPDSGAATAEARPGSKPQAVTEAAAAEAGSAVTVTQLSLRATERIGRTSFRYTFEVRAINPASTSQSVNLRLSQVGAGTTIVQGSIDTGPIAAGASQVVGSVVVTHDRNIAFNNSAWVWSVSEQVSAVRATVSPTVPATVSSSVRTLFSPVGSASPGNGLPIDLQTTTGGSWVLAVNGDGEVLLAAPVQAASVELSAESSALALVLMLSGSTGQTQSAAILRAKAAPSFASLVRAVETALAGGTVYSSDSTVLLAATKVIAEMLAVPTASSATGVKRRPLQVAQPHASRLALPFPLAQDLLLDQSNVAITGSCKDRGLFETSCRGGYSSDAAAVSVANLAPIPFMASVKDADGVAIASDIEIQTDDLTVARWIFKPHPIENPFSTAVATAIPTRGKSITLTFSHPAALRWKTFRTSLFELAGVALDALPIKTRTCADEAMKSFLGSIIGTGSSGGDPTFNDTMEAFFAAMRDPKQIATYFGACLRTGAPDFAEFNRLVLKLLDKQRGVLSKAKSAQEISTKLAKLLYLGYYWDYTTNTVGICVDSNGRLNNCNATLEFTPATVRAIAGTRLDTAVRLIAKDGNGAETIPSADLQYSSLGAPVIITLDPAKGIAVARSEGLTAVQLTDSATGVTGGYGVVVSKPQLKLAADNYKVGDYAVVRVVDAQGSTLLVPDDAHWESSRPDIAALDVGASLLNCGANPGCRAFKISSEGESTIMFGSGTETATTKISTTTSSPAKHWAVFGGTTSTCNAPGYSGSGNACFYAGFFKLLTPGFPLIRTGPQPLVKFGSGTATNPACTSLKIDLNVVDSFSMENDLYQILLPGSHPTTYVFRVLERKADRIVFERSYTFDYPAGRRPDGSTIVLTGSGKDTATAVSTSLPIACPTTAPVWCYKDGIARTPGPNFGTPAGSCVYQE